MTKQRRPPKSTRAQTHRRSARSVRRVVPASPPGVPVGPPRSPAPPSPPAPQRRTTYLEAVGIYERGLEALQRREYDRAANLFGSVLRQYPEEKELHERVRLYLNICQRQATAREAAPQTLDERLYAATLAINAGNYDRALQHLRLVRDEDPDNDYALYMLAVAHAQRGEPGEAIAHLERAIALNPENRALAKNDPDLEPLRRDEAFRSAIEAPATARADHRRPVRTRTAR